MTSYAIGRMPAIEVGADAVTRLPELLGGGGAVLVVDGALADGAYAAAVAGALADAGPLTVARVPPGEPTADSVDAVTESVRRHPAATVVGVGGGSALDTAKQAAAASAAGGSIERYALCAEPFAGRRAIIAVPTTAGTGSEVTRTCIVTDRAGTKVWTWGDELLPDVVLLDPRATVSMPAAVTAATGLDAVVHALEAASGQRRNPMVQAPAAEALRLAARHLHRAVEDGSDLAARQAMQVAALLAGLAIDAGGTGMAHSIGHALGTLAKVPHGVAVAVGMVAALDWNVAGAAEAYDAVAAALGIEPGAVPSWFTGLARSVGLGAVLAGRGPLALDPEDIARWMVAEENRPMYANNARQAGAGDRMALAERTVACWTEWAA